MKEIFVHRPRGPRVALFATGPGWFLKFTILTDPSAVQRTDLDADQHCRLNSQVRFCGKILRDNTRKNGFIKNITRCGCRGEQRELQPFRRRTRKITDNYLFVKSKSKLFLAKEDMTFSTFKQGNYKEGVVLAPPVQFPFVGDVSPCVAKFQAPPLIMTTCIQLGLGLGLGLRLRLVLVVELVVL